MPAELPPLRICFDATRLKARLALGVPTGIDRVDLAYLQALSADRAVSLSLAACGPLGVQVLKPAAARHLVETIQQTWQSQPRGEQRRFAVLRDWLRSPALTPRPTLPAESIAAAPETARKRLATAITIWAKPRASASLFIHTSHGQLHRPVYSRWLRRQPWKNLFFVHDLIPIEYPEYNRPAEPARHAARLETIAAYASGVIVNSAATREVLQAYWAAQRVAAPPITIAPLGISLDVSDASLPPPQAQVPYFVMLGTIEPRKNHLLLLHLWRQMIETDPDRTPRLVLVGRRGWENEAVFNLLDRAPFLRRHIIECSGLDDSELLALLRGARALLSPSFAEGFGLPVAEALAAGTPVLASSLAAHREVGGAAADYLDPLDGLGWLEAIRAYSSEPSPRRADALQRLAHYQPPTWPQHFEIVRETIQRLLA